MSGRASGLWVLLALTCATIEPIVAKLGFRTGASALQLLVLRNLFAAVTIAVVMRRWPWVGWERMRAVLGVALLLLATNGLVLYALQTMSAVSVVTATTTTPAFVALVNRWRGRDELTPRFWAGFAACFLGVLLTIDAFDGAKQSFDPRGVAALALAVASSTVYRTRMESVTARVEPRVVSTWLFTINAVVVSLAIWPWLDPIPPGALLSSAWIGIAAVLANVAFLSAIRLVGATRMSMFDMLQRPLVIIGASLVLSEPISVLQGVGVVLVLVGIRLAKVTRRAPPAPAGGLMSPPAARSVQASS